MIKPLTLDCQEKGSSQKVYLIMVNESPYAVYNDRKEASREYERIKSLYTLHQVSGYTLNIRERRISLLQSYSPTPERS